MADREFIEYGVRYSGAGGTRVTEYGTDREAAKRDSRQRPAAGHMIELVRRKVTVSPWTTGVVCPREIPAKDDDDD